MNIVFLDSTAIPKHIPIPRPSFPHNWVEYEYTSAEQTIERAKDADIIITSKVILSREVLQQLPKLNLIAITATGTNNVDLEAAKELGVAVKNVTGYSATTVPEHVLGMIFALKHSLLAGNAIKSPANGLRVNNSVILIIPLQMLKVQR